MIMYIMPNYSQGKIYKIISASNDKFYVGSTTKQYLSERLCEHRAHYRKWLKNGGKYVTSFDIIKNGDEKIVLLERVDAKDKDELLAKEQYYLDDLKGSCVNKINAKISPEESEAKRRDHMQSEAYKLKKANYDKKRQEKQKVENPNINKIKYQKYKEDIKARNHIQVICECGIKHNKGDTTRHKRTERHKKLLNILT